MSSQRLILSDLTVTRKGGPASRVEFADGLNVITGASDTGKSYILDCINYMLGGQSPPEQIPEAAPYSTLILGLSPANGRPFALERSLRDGGDFRLHIYEDAKASADKVQILASRHGHAGRSLSEHLLRYCEIGERTIRKSAGQSRELRFRDLVPFILVSETRIIDKVTPLRGTGQYVSETVELSTFDLLITGRDASSMVILPDTQTVEVNWEARRHLYDELIERLRAELKSHGSAAASSADAASQLEADIQAAEQQLHTITAQLNEAVAERARLLRTHQKLEARATSLAQLSERFTLLREHYVSDKERLRFVAEGDYLLAQLGEPHCPTCGHLLHEHSEATLAHDDVHSATIQAATRTEIGKLDIQLLDLAESLESLTAERNTVIAELEAQDREIARIDSTIQSSLEPVVFATRDTMSRLVAEREATARVETRKSELAELEARRQDLGDKPPSRKRASPAVGSTLERREFCDRMAETLRAWKYAAKVVEFDARSDLVIDGKARRSFGKGLRAVLHAAFNITLLRHTRDKGLPHPGFVVLDSPLTSFKGKDRYEVAGDVQRAFFEDLSTEKGCQIVIIENKEPPEDLRSGMHYIHFSGVAGLGRQGFLV